MSIESVRVQDEKELQARLRQLLEENFRARFTSEAMTHVRGTEIRKRRREIARIKTVLNGRRRLAELEVEGGRIEGQLEKLASKSRKCVVSRNVEAKLRRRNRQVKRALGQLAVLKGKR